MKEIIIPLKDLKFDEEVDYFPVEGTNYADLIDCSMYIVDKNNVVMSGLLKLQEIKAIFNGECLVKISQVSMTANQLLKEVKKTLPSFF